MATANLLALLDDIALTLDDVAVMTKVAAKKTAGVLGDDLALNAQQVSGVNADRELPVVWAVAKGSFVNKLILVPLALFISQISSTVVIALLILGGIYLCLEGFEKVFEKIFQHKTHPKPMDRKTPTDLSQYEKEKIKGAVRTDFILSAEIVVITLGTLTGKVFITQLLVLSAISLAITVGVYGLVALIVKIDDLGLFLLQKRKPFPTIGFALIHFAPALMKFLGITGTVAMFLVGGGILTHNIPFLHHVKESLPPVLGFAVDIVAGLIAGGLVAAVAHFFKKKTAIDSQF